MEDTFIKLYRNRETMELIKEPDAFILLTVIAIRARRTDTFNVYNLEPRQALIGDFANYGMTERRYRTSKAKLEKWGFVKIKATSRGTIATLLDDGIYDINLEVKGEQKTSKRRTSDERPTTNKNVKNGNKEKETNSVFEESRLLYPGTKRGYLTEYQNFCKKHADWREVLPLLKDAVLLQKAKLWAGTEKRFIPHLSTWLNNRQWEIELSTSVKPTQALCHCGKKGVTSVGNAWFCGGECRKEKLGW